ncbi:chemotaxis protein [Pseudomonas viridiflava]|uniref:chemotaxis protein n=1 Tax=Pseudomonas viridiflava TaxID=33069 RepID=UPI0018E60811|nr:chemotaxis protein [Pseudomonas viridiflava]MBI6705818.1 chemotaxis protein [Pseudomonas viridiflava]MBI6726818.1 chemotaxis protein [Pseudomonas viridiflava]
MSITGMPGLTLNLPTQVSQPTVSKAHVESAPPDAETAPRQSPGVQVNLSPEGKAAASSASRDSDIEQSGLPEGVQKILKAIREVQRKIEELQQQIQHVLADRGPGEDERNSRIATLRSSMGRLQQQVSNYSADLSVLMSRLKLDGGSRTLVSSLMVPNKAR